MKLCLKPGMKLGLGTGIAALERGCAGVSAARHEITHTHTERQA